ncbi:MAG: RIP metalloprotease RseP [Sandarakinorhabdus sp.]|jgi:regulator of sigma E protease|nr:RIP metalloprotease RseP [Sandarakinorhabdus sp.]
MNVLPLLPQPGLLFTLASFIGIIAVLVIVHEGGHYLAGRLFGARIEAFGVGFGPELIGRTDRRGVRWRLNAVPLGGYVKFVGDMNEASQADPAVLALPERERRGLFVFLPLWQRAVIVAAGPLINFLFAILVLALYNLNVGYYTAPARVAQVLPGSAAATAGLQAGDKVLEVDGTAVDRFEDIVHIVMTSTGAPIRLDIERGGRPLTLQVAPRMVENVDRFGNINKVPQLGIASPREELRPVGALAALRWAVVDTWGITTAIGRAIRQVITGERALTDMGGPVQTAKIAGEQASLGMAATVRFLAFFSINIGFINLLPIPMLDGGHLLLYGIEAVRRRPLADAVQQWAFMSGFAALMSLMAVLTWYDMDKVGVWQRLSGWLG